MSYGLSITDADPSDVQLTFEAKMEDIAKEIAKAYDIKAYDKPGAASGFFNGLQPAEKAQMLFKDVKTFGLMTEINTLTDLHATLPEFQAQLKKTIAEFVSLLNSDAARGTFVAAIKIYCRVVPRNQWENITIRPRVRSMEKPKPKPKGQSNTASGAQTPSHGYGVMTGRGLDIGALFTALAGFGGSFQQQKPQQKPQGTNLKFLEQLMSSMSTSNQLGM